MLSHTEHDPWETFPLLFGGFIVLFSLSSMIIKEWLFLSEALVATLFGIWIGPEYLNFIDPLQWPNIDKYTLEFARIVIALQVFAAGVNLPKAYLIKEWRSLTGLLLPVMAVMWGVTAMAMSWFLGMGMLEALLIAACVTPTDPVLANSIVRGRFAENHVPIHVRNIISAESGANDGLGFPYLYFPILILQSTSVSSALGEWTINIWLYQIALSVIIGGVIGYVARKVLFFCESRELIDKESFLVFGFALSLFIMGLVGIIRSDDLLACFIAGNAFTWDDWFRIEIESTHMQEVVDMFFNLSFFIFFGSIVPWQAFHEIGVMKLTLMSAVILLFRRVPIVLLMKPITPAFENYTEAFFAGWFGPIGVGAVFYAMVAKTELASMGPHYQLLKEQVFPIAAFLILASVLVHGMTVPLFKISRLDTRTITNLTSITNMVSRLPILKPGQTLVIERNDDMTTDILISQSNTPQQTLTQFSHLLSTNAKSSNSNSNFTTATNSNSNITTATDSNSNGNLNLTLNLGAQNAHSRTENGRPMSVSLTLTPDGRIIDRHEDYFHDLAAVRAASTRSRSRPGSVLRNRNTLSVLFAHEHPDEEAQLLANDRDSDYGTANQQV